MLKNVITTLFLSTLIAPITFVRAEPKDTTLKDYAFDFASVGYEIAFTAETSYFSDPMNSNDFFNLKADGYTIKARADKLSRSSRKAFVSYYNDNCEYTFSTEASDKCIVYLEGEVELDEDFQMVIWATKIDFLDAKTKESIKTFQ